MKKLIAILEHDPATIEAMNAWLDDRLPMYDRVVASDAVGLLRAIAPRMADVLGLSVRREVLDMAIDPSSDAAVLLVHPLRRPSQFPMLVYSLETGSVGATERWLVQEGWTVTSLGPLVGPDWVDRSWYPAFSRVLRDQALKRPPVLVACETGTAQDPSIRS